MSQISNLAIIHNMCPNLAIVYQTVSQPSHPHSWCPSISILILPMSHPNHPPNIYVPIYYIAFQPPLPWILIRILLLSLIQADYPETNPKPLATQCLGQNLNYSLIFIKINLALLRLCNCVRSK